MTEHLELARRVAEGLFDYVKAESGYGEAEYVSTEEHAAKPLDWLLTGDGMLLVKQEMAKRGYLISSFSNITNGNACIPGHDGFIFRADTEPLAVLMAAAKSLESK